MHFEKGIQKSCVHFRVEKQQHQAVYKVFVGSYKLEIAAKELQGIYMNWKILKFQVIINVDNDIGDCNGTFWAEEKLITKVLIITWPAPGMIVQR